MARRPSSRSRKSKKVSIDWSKVGKGFEPDMEYAVEVSSCTLEEGDAGPYFAMQFKGLDEGFEDAILYHNASTSPQSLWRMRSLVEAFGMDIEDGPMDYEPDDFVGQQCMVSTVSENKPGGGKAIRIDEYWEMEDGAGKKSSSEKDSGDFNLDNVSDADVKKLAKEFEIKVGRGAKGVEAAREELAEADDEELKEACDDLDIGYGGEEKEEEKPSRGRRRSSKEDDDDETEEKPRGRSSRGSRRSSGKSGKGKSADVTEDEVNEMSEEELEDLIEQHDLDVDLGDFRTLRKKKAAVIDALQEAGVIED